MTRPPGPGYGWRMGLDDENEGFGAGECLEHEWVPAEFPPVQREGLTLPDGTPMVGFAIVNECKWCDATFYEPSNLDRWPDTKGIDPRL